MSGNTTRSSAAALVVLSLAVAACGSDGSTAAPDETSRPSVAPAGEQSESGATRPATDQANAELDAAPTIVVTTNVLGDVVGEVLGDAAVVVTIMPVNADPHDFQASAREIDQLMQADALIVNGGAYEEGLLDVIDNAGDSGVPTFEALNAVQTIEYDGDDHDDHGDDDKHGEDDHENDTHDDDHDKHGEDEHDEVHGEHDEGEEKDDDESHHEDEEHHDHSGEDPHFFTDPNRMADAVDGIVDFLQDTVEFADPDAVEASAAAYLAALNELDADVAGLMSGITDDGRVLVTNHQVFGYFADRYDFEVIGAVIPSGTTLDTASGGDLSELADLIEAEGVPAIFSDTSASDELIQTLAAEIGDVDVVALYTESLGGPGSDGGTYLEMVRTNSERIADALDTGSGGSE